MDAVTGPRSIGVPAAPFAGRQLALGETGTIIAALDLLAGSQAVSRPGSARVDPPRPQDRVPASDELAVLGVTPLLLLLQPYPLGLPQTLADIGGGDRAPGPA